MNTKNVLIKLAGTAQSVLDAQNVDHEMIPYASQRLDSLLREIENELSPQEQNLMAEVSMDVDCDFESTSSKK